MCTRIERNDGRKLRHPLHIPFIAPSRNKAAPPVKAVWNLEESRNERVLLFSLDIQSPQGAEVPSAIRDRCAAVVAWRKLKKQTLSIVVTEAGCWILLTLLGSGWYLTCISPS